MRVENIRGRANISMVMGTRSMFGVCTNVECEWNMAALITGRSGKRCPNCSQRVEFYKRHLISKVRSSLIKAGVKPNELHTVAK